MKKKLKGEERTFSLLLVALWVIFIGVTSVSLISVIDRLPPFRIKEIIVSGNERINFEDIKESVYKAQDESFAVSKEALLRELTRKYGRRVGDVKIERDMSLEGVSLKVVVEERKPVAKVRVGKKLYLIDKEGNLFEAIEGENTEDLVELKAYDLDKLLDSFGKLYRYVIDTKASIHNIVVKRDRIEIFTGHRKIILPPLDLLSQSVRRRLNVIYNYSQGKVDLRYDRFILIR